MPQNYEQFTSRANSKPKINKKQPFSYKVMPFFYQSPNKVILIEHGLSVDQPQLHT